ncbi:MAG TPA: GGDEF domain-containing protein [Burkholderiaceae bacterium]
MKFLNLLDRSFAPNLERSYQDDLAEEKVRVAWQTNLLCMLLYAGFGILDYWAAPSTLSTAHGIRACVLAVTIAVTALSVLRRAFFLTHYTAITTATYLTWGIGIELIIVLSDPRDLAWTTYYAGLILVSIALYTWTYLRSWAGCAVGVALVASYMYGAMAHQQMGARDQWHVLITNCFFLISANLVGLFSLHTRERFSRQAYLLKNALRHDLELQEEAKRQSDHLSQHDVLTALPNRLHFMRRLAQLVSATATGQGNAAVLFIDLDGFKPINDTQGHHAGDAVLVEIARRIRGCIRGSDICARMGGDEFVVALQVPADYATVLERMMHNLADAIAAPIAFEGRSLRVTASIGEAVYPRDGAGPEALLQAADQRMYKAKRAGKQAQETLAAVQQASKS